MSEPNSSIDVRGKLVLVDSPSGSRRVGPRAHTPSSQLPKHETSAPALSTRLCHSQPCHPRLCHSQPCRPRSLCFRPHASFCAPRSCPLPNHYRPRSQNTTLHASWNRGASSAPNSRPMEWCSEEFSLTMTRFNLVFASDMLTAHASPGSQCPLHCHVVNVHRFRGVYRPRLNAKAQVSHNV